MNQIQPSDQKRLHVLMITEGTYPYYFGGVSTWCHLLLTDLSHVDFTLLTLASDASATSQFVLPPNVIDFRPIGLWGTREAAEARRGFELRRFLQTRAGTGEEVISQDFIPEFRAFLHELYATTADPSRLGAAIHSMYRFFLGHDFDKALRSHAAWECFLSETQAFFPPAAARNGYPGATFNLADLTAGMQWLYHWLFPLAQPLPRADVVHAAMAGLCTLVAVAVKLEYGTPYMLTEHGIYLRERFLAEAGTQQSLFRKLFNLQFALRMTELSYVLADMIAPCCDYNQRWELRNGAQPAQIRTIYYGVDSSAFMPTHKPFGDPPTVVWVGRIDPLKDLLTLIQAAGAVHAERPDIKFQLIGSAPAGNEGYYDRCLALRAELGLDDVVNFAGFRANPAGAYNEADVVVLSSVSEAFPFSILEAMLCEKPVVATAVGGIPEQVAGCGYTVEPRNPEQMARAILTLMNNPELAQALGRNARAKAVEAYGVRQSGLAHEIAYRQLIADREAAHSQVTAEPAQEVCADQAAEPQAELRDASLIVSAEGIALIAGYEPGRGDHGGGLVGDHGGPVGAQAGTNGHKPTSNGDGHPVEGLNGGPVSSIEPEGSDNQVQVTPVVASSGNGTATAQCENGDGVSPDDPAQTSLPQLDWSIRHAAGLATLAEDIEGRVPYPINGLEVTALLESMGITDTVASERYGAPNAFDLGYEVLTWVRARRASNSGHAGNAPAWARPVSRRQRATRALPAVAGAAADYARGPMSLIMCLSILLAVTAFDHLGGWSARRVLVLSIGFSAGQLMTSAFVLAAGRRTSIYLGMGKRLAAGRFFAGSAAIAFMFVDLVALLLLLVSSGIPAITTEDRLTFVPAFLGLSAVWLLGGGLSLVRKTGWLAVGLVAGLGLGVGVDRAVAGFTAMHLTLGALAGSCTTLTVLLVALYRNFFDRKPNAKPVAWRLPPLGYLLYEGAPYFAYSYTYLIFILVPHLLAWMGALPAGLLRLDAVTGVEIGLTLGLVPLILTVGVLERAVMEFWRFTRGAQESTPGNDVGRFPHAVTRFYFHYWGLHTLVLTVLSIVAFAAFRLDGSAGLTAGWGVQMRPDQAASFFALGLGIYWLLGWGIFNCTFCMSLGCTSPLIRVSLVSLAVTVILGVPLSVGLGYSYALVAFSGGAMAFVLGTQWVTRRVLASSDYHYVSSV